MIYFVWIKTKGSKQLSKCCKICQLYSIASSFHFHSSSGMFDWSSGPLGLWTSEVSASVHWIEKEGAALPSPAPLPLTIQFHLLSTPEELSSALWNGETQKGKKKSEPVLFQAFNSMALSSRNSLDTTLLLTSLFLVCFAQFIFFYFLYSLVSDWLSSSSSGILLQLQLHNA